MKKDIFLRVAASLVCIIVFSPLAHSAPQFSEQNGVVTSSDGVPLSAVWTTPESTPKAVALIIQGSGNVGSDGDVSGPLLGSGYQGQPAKLSVEIAESLAMSGVASLRYAKRGFDDPKQLVNQTIPYFVQDATAALAQMKARFPSVRTMIVGFSEGGLVATIVAAKQRVDGLFLMSPATRSLDELLAYQFLDWPVNLIRSHLDVNQDGVLSKQELASMNGEAFPLLGPTLSGLTAEQVGEDELGAISIAAKIIPAYQQTYAMAVGLMKTPMYSGWYNSWEALPEYSSYARRIQVPVFIYQAEDDAQLSWSWSLSAQHYFPKIKAVHLFPGFGHCFSPMEGSFGEIKTSGPMDASVLNALSTDVESIF